MDMHLLSNKNLRVNYEKAIKVTTKEECDAFVNSLSERDHMELITYCEEVALVNKRRHGVPIKEYFLLHLEEYITESEKKTGSAACATLDFLTMATLVFLGPLIIILAKRVGEGHTLPIILTVSLAICITVFAFRFSLNIQRAFCKKK